MRRIIRALLIYVWPLVSLELAAQGGYNTGVYDSLIDLPCNQTCENLTYQVPHLRSTTDYLVTGLRYNPYAYNTAAGNEVTSIYADDRYSAVITMPFNFCFYDSVYSELVIGSNGLITFEKSLAGCVASYQVLQPLPYAGGTPCLLNSVYYPRASIMAAFSDLDLRLVASPADRKVEWRVEGNAPFRRFIVSYYHVGLFEGDCGTPNTFQIILYETTGVIDIFFEQKTCTSSSSAGRAIMGLQNWAKDKAIAPPATNSTIWEAHETGYRFIPSGGVSRFVSAELYDINNVLLSRGDTATTDQGWLDIKYDLVCLAGGAEKFISKITFSGCDLPGDITGLDTFIIRKTNLLNLQTVLGQSQCGLPGTGSARVIVPTGIGTAPYTFSLHTGTGIQTFTDPGSWEFAGLPAGNYSVDVTDAGTCAQTIDFVITSAGVLNVSFTATNTSCEGANNGKIEVNPPNGLPPLQYSIDGGITFTPNNIFTGLAPKDYELSVKDNGGCAADNIPITIRPGAPISISTSAIPPSCPGMNNGSITITGSSGTPPFTYSILNGPYQANPTFDGLGSGPYFIGIKDAVGCTLNFVTVNVPAGTSMVTGRAMPAPVTCNGNNDGSITVLPTSGTGPYEYSINNGANWQANPLFNGLPPGDYSILIRESGICTSLPIPVTVTQPPVLTAPAPVITPAICNGTNTGKIAISPVGGTLPYSYSLDNINFGQDNNFNVPAGNYTIYVMDANGCRIQSGMVTITEPSPLNANVVGTTDASCSSDGSIRVNVTGGVGPYTYSVDGQNFQSVNELAVKNGNYDVTVKDNNDCSVVIPGVNIGLVDNLILNVVAPQPVCEGRSVQLQATGNANSFNWVVTGTNAIISSVNNPVLAPVTTTTYTVMAALGNCRRNMDVIVPVMAAPMANAGAGDEICFGQNYQLQGSGGASYSWWPTTYLDDPHSPNPQVIKPQQTTTYSLLVTDNNDCTSLQPAQVVVTVTPPVRVTVLPADTVVYPGVQFQLIARSAGNNYSWSPSTNLINPDSNAPVVTAGAAGTTVTYTVIASTDAGCQGEGTAVVRIYKGPDIYVPSAFSPNGDGKNEVFYPFPVGIKKLKQFSVFNRWGQLLFSTTTLHKGWDGRMGGREQAGGVYIWTFEGVTPDNQVISRSGTVTLIR